MSFKTIFNNIKISITNMVGKVNWTVPAERTLQLEDLDTVRELLRNNYLIILTRHPGHLSTYAIQIAHWCLTGKWGHYGHALLNVEDDVNVDDDFHFMEATMSGVHYSKFSDIFDSQCGSVCLLKPRAVSLDEWLRIVEKSKSNLGKPYDTALDVHQDAKLNCIELVRSALQGEPNYATDFADLERMIHKYENLDPHMAYECTDFEVVYEVRR
jgi:hypothetical protein